MENQTRFDLNAAIESWRSELAAQPNLAPDDRRELEAHLRDAIAGFQQRGLNDEESFCLARRRAGQPPQLGEEFVKADPAKVWRERVFWMWLGLFLYVTLGNATGLISYMLLTPINSNGRSVDAANLLLAMLPILTPLIAIIIVVILVSRKINWLFHKLEPFVKTQLRVAISTFAMITFVFSMRLVTYAMYEVKLKHLNLYNLHDFRPPFQNEAFAGCYYPLILALVLVLLAPPQNRKTPKRA